MATFQDYYAIRAAVITVTTDCQLRCSYCFEQDKSPNYMTDKTAQVTIEALCNNFKEKVFANDPTAKLSISFFGGEPTLNFDVIKQMVEYCNTQPFIVQYGITTNCVHITDEMIDFFYDNNFGILVSIDGTEYLHNRNRCNSYQVVTDNIKRMFDGGLKLSMEARITIPPNDVQYTFDSMKNMYDLGFDQIAPCFVYDQEWNEESYAVFEQEIRKIYKFAFDVYQSDTKRNLQVKNIEDFIFLCYDHNTNDTSPCGFGKDVWVSIGYDGEIAPCHQVHTNFRNRSEFHMGNIVEGTFNQAIADMITHDFDRSSCSLCEYNTVCLGGCPAENYSTYKNFNALNPAVCRHMAIMYTIAKEYQQKILDTPNLRSRRLNILKRNLEFKKLLETASEHLETSDLNDIMMDFSAVQETIFGEEKILLPAYIKLGEQYITKATDRLLLDMREVLQELQQIVSSTEGEV